jgi:hypothetical protein
VRQQAGILAFMDTFRVLAMVFVGLMPFMLLMRGTRRERERQGGLIGPAQRAPKPRACPTAKASRAGPGMLI